MPAEFLVRVLNETDYAEYRTLRLRALREHPEAFTSSYEEELSAPYDNHIGRFRRDPGRPHNVMFGASRDGKLVGMVGFEALTRQKERHKGHIFAMYVVVEAAGRGVGRALLEAAIQHARAVPELEILNLSVTGGNRAAITLYEGCGFRRYGREPRAVKIGNRYFDKDDMWLDLSAKSS